MIEIKGLYKSFDDKTVLSDINADFANGKTNLIIGQSGSGKTVLMKCMWESIGKWERSAKPECGEPDTRTVGF